MNSFSPDPDLLLAEGRDLCRNGRLAEGAEVFRKLIDAAPGHVLAHNFLGMALDRLGRPADAIASFDRAIAADPNFAEALANKADALSALGRFSESIDFYDRALATAPDPMAWYNRGVALHELKRYEDALASFDRAIVLDPDGDAAIAGRTRSLKALGRTREALESANRAIALRKNSPAHHSDRGLVLKVLGQTNEARSAFEQALALDSDSVPTLTNLAGLLIENGDLEAALPVLRRALALRETDELKGLFLAYLLSLPTPDRAAEISDLLLRAIEEPWSNPPVFATAAVAALIFDRAFGLTVASAVAAWPRVLPAAELYGLPGLQAIAKNRLLRALLTSAPVPNGSLEQFLTMARTALLETALVARSSTAAASPPHPDVLEFYCALARQCFVNEYVFTVSPEEIMRIRMLEGELDRALSSGNPVPPVWLAAIAAYSSLGSLPAGPVLLGRGWPDPVKALLQQQVVEPREEQRLRASIPRLTEIESGASETEHQQYEENPYPRWVRAAQMPPPRHIDSLLREMFPLAQIRERELGRGP